LSRKATDKYEPAIAAATNNEDFTDVAEERYQVGFNMSSTTTYSASTAEKEGIP